MGVVLGKAMNSTVSVLTIKGTGRPYLSSALRSLVNQDLREWESVVIDSCSKPEDSLMVARQVAEVADDRVKILRYDGPGGFPPYASKKWNFGISRSVGGLIAFLDSDDMKGPGWLSAMCGPLIADKSLSATLSSGHVIDSAGTIRSGLFREPSLDLAYLLGPNFVTTGQIVVRRSVIEAMGGFDESLGCSEDWEFCLRLSKMSWRHVDGIKCLKRETGDNACYHPNVVEYTQDVLRRIISKHGIAPGSCHECGKRFPEGYAPFVWAVAGLGFRLWHSKCAIEKQRK